MIWLSFGAVLLVGVAIGFLAQQSRVEVLEAEANCLRLHAGLLHEQMGSVATERDVVLTEPRTTVRWSVKDAGPEDWG